LKKAANEGTYQAEMNIAMAWDPAYELYEQFCSKVSLLGAPGLLLDLEGFGEEKLVIKPWDPALKKEKTFMRDLQRMPYGPMYRVLTSFLTGACIPLQLVKDGPLEFVGGSKKNKVCGWDLILNQIAYEKTVSTVVTWMNFWAIRLELNSGKYI